MSVDADTDAREVVRTAFAAFQDQTQQPAEGKLSKRAEKKVRRTLSLINVTSSSHFSSYCQKAKLESVKAKRAKQKVMKAKYRAKKEANGKAIALLYNSLPHPPATYMGSDPSGVTWTTSASPSPLVPPYIAPAVANGDAKAQVTTASYGSFAPPRVPWAISLAKGPARE